MMETSVKIQSNSALCGYAYKTFTNSSCIFHSISVYLNHFEFLVSVFHSSLITLLSNQCIAVT